MIAGVRWDSKREYRRWLVLYEEFAAGIITELKRQVRYPLVVNGRKVCVFVSDFVYRRDGVLIVEDCKGFRTPVYVLKAKLFRACYGFDILET